MAPKKINWDLKRDIQPKLAKLEKRTQKAIVEMLKKRLELEASQAADDDDDDDDDDGDLD
jgi:coiled-coil domain-containing protein 12